jgi:hypothetical protein
MIWLGLFILSVLLIPAYTRVFRFKAGDTYGVIKEAEKIVKGENHDKSR